MGYLNSRALPGRWDFILVDGIITYFGGFFNRSVTQRFKFQLLPGTNGFWFYNTLKSLNDLWCTRVGYMWRIKVGFLCTGERIEGLRIKLPSTTIAFMCVSSPVECLLKHLCVSVWFTHKATFHIIELYPYFFFNIWALIRIGKKYKVLHIRTELPFCSHLENNSLNIWRSEKWLFRTQVVENQYFEMNQHFSQIPRILYANYCAPLWQSCCVTLSPVTVLLCDALSCDSPVVWRSQLCYH